MNSVNNYRYTLAFIYAESIIQNRCSDFDNALRIAIIYAFLDGYEQHINGEVDDLDKHADEYVYKTHSNATNKYQRYMNRCVFEAYKKGYKSF